MFVLPSFPLAVAVFWSSGNFIFRLGSFFFCTFVIIITAWLSACTRLWTYKRGLSNCYNLIKCAELVFRCVPCG